MFNLTLIILFVLTWVRGNFGSNDYVLEENSLLMVHALFRHGERTSDSFYPTDPYINHTFYPMGKGGLTNRGKQQEYDLGAFLRKRYDNFLGDVYTNDIMDVRSTGFLRTRMSAQLVLAGLWPPSEKQKWNGDLPWLPIPVDYKPYEEDDLLNPGVCKKRIAVLKKQHEIEEVKRVYVTPYKDLMEYAQANSGKIIKSPIELVELYLILRTEEDTNLTLPTWSRPIYPEPLYGAASLVYSYFNYNPDIKKINAGYFLKKVLDDFKSKINEDVSKKIFLYSGHESTLGNILDALKVKPHIASYGSVVLFELHKTTVNTHVVKVLYKQGVEKSTVLQEIWLPGCQSLCSFDKFEGFLKDNLPNVPYNEACRI
ncbi:uncharacterized protein CBL_04683 [Carabus blaptoides fortunei]